MTYFPSGVADDRRPFKLTHQQKDTLSEIFMLPQEELHDFLMALEMHITKCIGHRELQLNKPSDTRKNLRRLKSKLDKLSSDLKSLDPESHRLIAEQEWATVSQMQEKIEWYSGIVSSAEQSAHEQLPQRGNLQDYALSHLAHDIAISMVNTLNIKPTSTAGTDSPGQFSRCLELACQAVGATHITDFAHLIKRALKNLSHN